MKKRTAALFLALWMMFGLMGCGGGSDEQEQPEETPTPVEEPEPVPEPEPEPEPDPVDPARERPGDVRRIPESTPCCCYVQ